MVVMVIVLMNLLIAVIMDGFERIMERAHLSARAEKAQIICDMELMMTPWELNDPKLFPLWIHVLVPKHKHKAGGYHSAWQGRMWNMKAHVTDEMDRTRTAISNDLRVVAQVRRCAPS